MFWLELHIGNTSANNNIEFYVGKQQIVLNFSVKNCAKRMAADMQMGSADASDEKLDMQKNESVFMTWCCHVITIYEQILSCISTEYKNPELRV